jgi:signal peptidase I
MLKQAADAQPKRDSIRESAETLVFVVVLVLIMKLFVVDAYVIPTGSMGETLYGYRKPVTCLECGHKFSINASEEVEPQKPNDASTMTGYCCPNCNYANSPATTDVDWRSGDRVIVGKALSTDDREKVVVFKYPSGPQENQVGKNFIKRLMGLGEETIAIHGGDLYITKSLKYDPKTTDAKGVFLYTRPKNDVDLWKTSDNGRDYSYPNAKEAVNLFLKNRQDGFKDKEGFQIFRKSDEMAMVLRRIVYDNEQQSKKLAEIGAPARWSSADPAWSFDNVRMPRTFTHVGTGLHWVRYRHLLPEEVPFIVNGQGWTKPTTTLTPHLITNYMGYNGGFKAQGGLGQQLSLDESDHWVGDLMIECEATTSNASDVVVLELSKGTHRYRVEIDNGQARFKMFPGQMEILRTDGNMELVMNRVAVGDDKNTLFTKAITFAPGKHAVRFANFDTRLRLWIDEESIDLGESANYTPPSVPTDVADERRWTQANDINEPVNIGATGQVVFGKLRVYRDNHYVNMREKVSLGVRNRLERTELDTFYVQPGHYLCLGDNSAQSSDGREWGLVPQRLMLGRAVFVFWPIDRIGFIK